jgi:protein SCO1/2
LKHLLTSKNIALAVLLFLAGCGSAPAKHYPIQAEVVSVDVPKKLIFVKHGEIPGMMPAMTMSYMVAAPKEIEGLAPGDKISADLVVSESMGHLEKIVLVEKAKPVPTPASPAPEGSPQKP